MILIATIKEDVLKILKCLSIFFSLSLLEAVPIAVIKSNAVEARKINKII